MPMQGQAYDPPLRFPGDEARLACFERSKNFQTKGSAMSCVLCQPLEEHQVFATDLRRVIVDANQIRLGELMVCLNPKTRTSAH